MKEINIKNLQVNEVENKLDSMEGTDVSATAQLVMLTLRKTSKKYGMPDGAPFPAVVKPTTNGGLAVFNCVTGKKEIIPDGTFKEPMPIRGSFEYKGHQYKHNLQQQLWTVI